MAQKIFTVMLCNDNENRFYPVGEEEKPWQFHNLLHTSYSMLQLTSQKTAAIADEQMVVTKLEYANLVRTQLQDVRLCIEPVNMGTESAIQLAARHIAEIAGSDALMVVLPCNLYTENEENLLEAIRIAIKFAQRETLLVTLGIPTEKPKIDQGYIEKGDIFSWSSHPIYSVKSFNHNPNICGAIAYFKNPDFFYSSGIFVWTVGNILEAIKKYSNENYEILNDILPVSTSTFDDAYSKLNPALIESNVIKKAAENDEVLSIIPDSLDLDDIGSFNKVSEYWSDVPTNSKVNRPAQIYMKDCSNCRIYIGNNSGEEIILHGVRDCFIVKHKGKTFIRPFSKQAAPKLLSRTLTKLNFFMSPEKRSDAK